jgi:hypothetical protein
METSNIAIQARMLGEDHEIVVALRARVVMTYLQTMNSRHDFAFLFTDCLKPQRNTTAALRRPQAGEEQYSELTLEITLG